MTAPIDPEFEARVIKIIVAQTKNPETLQVGRNSSLAELGLDSFDAIQVIFDLEDAFRVEIPVEGARNFTTVGEIVDQLHKLCIDKNSAA